MLRFVFLLVLLSLLNEKIKDYGKNNDSIHSDRLCGNA